MNRTALYYAVAHNHEEAVRTLAKNYPRHIYKPIYLSGIATKRHLVTLPRIVTCASFLLIWLTQNNRKSFQLHSDQEQSVKTKRKRGPK